jgi:hypothetical protein
VLPGVTVTAASPSMIGTQPEATSENDRNCDRHYQLGEEGAPTDSALAGSIQIDPTITQPYSHNVAVYLRWSLQTGGGHTWSDDFPEGYPNDPNAPMDERRTRWDVKLSANYEAPWAPEALTARSSSGGDRLRAPDLGRLGKILDC